jgi:hypothetical protein
MIFQKFFNRVKLAKTTLLLTTVINSYLIASAKEDRIYPYKKPIITKDTIFKIENDKLIVNDELLVECYKSARHYMKNDTTMKHFVTMNDICDSFEPCIKEERLL